MKKSSPLKRMIISTLLCLLPILFALSVYNKLPAVMPIHFNINGEADGFASKAFASFGLPLVLALLNILVHFGLNADPKKNNAKGVVQNLGFWVIPALSTIINSIVILIALGNNIRIEIIVPFLVGVLFIVIGNYLPKCKQNYTVGIKLPWTLNSEENWNKTHRLGGMTMFLSGILLVVSAFAKGIFLYVLIVGIILAVIVPIIYSYALYRKGI